MQWEKQSSKGNQHISDWWCVVYFLEFPDTNSSDEDYYYKEDENVDNNIAINEEDKNSEIIPFIQNEEPNMDNTPANEKTGNYYKDIKQCKTFKLIAMYKKKLQQQQIFTALICLNSPF